MKKFMDEDFLLTTKTAKKLFKLAKEMPIYDYHCHLSPKEIYKDKKYDNLTEVWLGGDHYKWRFMRSMGIEEKYITGDASPYEKFLSYAKVMEFAVGNPLYHWSHLELQRYFGIYDTLSEKTAEKIWKKANAVIRGGDFSARQLIEKSNVAMIGTTDDPCDDLSYHKLIKEDKSFKTIVAPTFRPDNAINIEKDGFAAYVEKLEKASNTEIKCFNCFKEALKQRIDYFHAVGARISDHSFLTIPYEMAEQKELVEIFAKGRNGEALTQREENAFKTAMMIFLGEEYAKRGWVMQLHMGPIRNNSARMFEKLGADTGFDSIGDGIMAENLSKYLNSLDRCDLLPKTILYTLNPTWNYVIGTMLGNFQSGGIRGKIQFGSAWWFCDNIDGMTEQMKTLGNLGALAAFVGMLTDSRSFLSYPRHEYFRRILCRIVGEWVENGEFTDNEDTLAKIIRDISFNNAKNYFGIELEEN